LALLLAASASAGRDESLAFEGKAGPGLGKRVVLLAGDEEYRSEEALPQLAKILAYRHGFHCTVLFSLASDGTIDPERRDNQPGLEALAEADLCVLMLRFRQWPDAQMARFADYVEGGGPLVALRTSTHAFDGLTGPYGRYNWRGGPWPGGFGRQVLGETWVSHWGEHGRQATRGHPVGRHPVIRGVAEAFVTTDVYEAHPPPDATVVVEGEVVAGMRADDPPAAGARADSHGVQRLLNEPRTPVAWVREPRPGQRVFTTTMGSATDLLDGEFRRLLVNAAYWACGLSVPERASAGLWGTYQPSPFGFGGWRKGLRPADYGEVEPCAL
jgi:hypothetical protein